MFRKSTDEIVGIDNVSQSCRKVQKKKFHVVRKKVDQMIGD